jgi:serine/threonine protein phosphatase PrpC
VGPVTLITDTCARLIDLANDHGGKDNLSPSCSYPRSEGDGTFRLKPASRA